MRAEGINLPRLAFTIDSKRIVGYPKTIQTGFEEVARIGTGTLV